jgi:hypothetical protein
MFDAQFFGKAHGCTWKYISGGIGLLRLYTAEGSEFTNSRIIIGAKGA